MTRHLGEYKSELEYNNIAYNKGLILFDMLRGAVGDNDFNAALKKYYQNNLCKTASPENLIASFTGGPNVEGIFNSFLDGNILI